MDAAWIECMQVNDCASSMIYTPCFHMTLCNYIIHDNTHDNVCRYCDGMRIVRFLIKLPKATVNYIRHDLRAILWPQSLPDPPGYVPWHTTFFKEIPEVWCAVVSVLRTSQGLTEMALRQQDVLGVVEVTTQVTRPSTCTRKAGCRHAARYASWLGCHTPTTLQQMSCATAARPSSP